MPKCYGSHTTIYNRYARWARRGIWKSIFDALVHQNEDSLFFIDSSIVKAHRAATGAKEGDWRRILAAHAKAAQVKFTLVDESGRPRCLIITGGQVHDSQVMINLLDDEGHEKIDHVLRKTELEFSGNGANICNAVMDQLSPHPRVRTH